MQALPTFRRDPPRHMRLAEGLTDLSANALSGRGWRTPHRRLANEVQTPEPIASRCPHRPQPVPSQEHHAHADRAVLAGPGILPRPDVPLVEDRDVLRSRSQSRRHASMPAGGPAPFIRVGLCFTIPADAKTFANPVGRRPDTMREPVADRLRPRGGTAGYPVGRLLDRAAPCCPEERGSGRTGRCLDAP